MNRWLAGALAGMTATTAMTMAMRAWHRRLPPGERYPLPPREITEAVAATVNLPADALPEASLASHFLYGAATGALYGGLLDRPGLPAAAAAGAAWGVAVWTLSYLGWIPATGILRPATSHPARRNLLMIGAHLVWGTVTGLATRELGRADAVLAGGGSLDRR